MTVMLSTGDPEEAMPDTAIDYWAKIAKPQTHSAIHTIRVAILELARLTRARNSIFSVRGCSQP
jgi:hypothetical protein